jgi:hypothetical protein
MDHCLINKTMKHVNAAENLVTKLLLNPALVGMDREREKARLINTFHAEYRDFSCRMGHFSRVHIWVSAENPLEKAYRWHQNYSLLYTEVLGKLACLVTSKILGIGTAERNWKQVKAVKSGQRTNTGVLKAKHQVMIYSQYQAMKAQARITRMSCAGKLWTDDDFKCCMMDEYCGDIEADLAREKGGRDNEVRNFRAWQEQWEKKKLGPTGDKSLRQGCSGSMQGSSLSTSTPILTESSGYTHQQCNLRRSVETTTTQLLALWMGLI